MKKLKELATALPFIGALLMLSFEAQPGPYYLARQLCITVPAIALLVWTAVLSHKKPKTPDRGATYGAKSK